MPKILRTPKAMQDMVEAAGYIHQDNPSAAERFITSIDETLTMLSENPLAGRERPELLPEIRSFPLKSYVVFYRPILDGVEVLRVLHGNRDVERYF